MNRIFAFDIDGTITHLRDGINPLIVDRLRSLSAEGWTVALLTGRLFSYASKILDYLDFPYYLAVQNGSEILWMPDKKKLEKNYLSEDIIPQIEKAYEGIRGDFLIYAGRENGDFCYFRKEKFTSEELAYLKILERIGGTAWVESAFSFEPGTAFPLIKCFGPPSEMTKLNQKLINIADIEVSMIRDPIDPSLYLNLITHPSANKGSALKFLKNHLDATFVIAAGDDANDRKMLEAADLRIVIETAPKEILLLADIVAKPPEELGIIQAIDEATRHASH